MSVVELSACGWLGCALIMCGFWLLYRARDKASYVDVGWAACLGFLAVCYAILGQGSLPRRTGLAVLVGLWSWRLSSHLWHRIGGESGEDGRYIALRDHWKTGLGFKFFLFFQAQALLALLLSIPFLVIAQNDSAALSAWEIAGLGLWLLAWLGESAADHQLKRFIRKRTDRSQVCREGWWRYSRHPNYFFEWLVWVAMSLIAIAAPHGAFGLIAPFLMLFFLLFVTGIPPTEAQAVRTKGDAYRAYQQSTNAFFPWFPKGDNS